MVTQDPQPISLPPSPQSFDGKHYAEFYEALKKGAWHHKTSEADRIIGDKPMLLWCSIRAIEWLPDMLGSASKINVLNEQGRNACMLALENNNITFEIFEKLIQARISPWLDEKHQSSRRGLYYRYGFPNPFISLFTSYSIQTDSQEKCADRQKIEEYLILNLPKSDKVRETIEQAISFFMRRHPIYKDESSTTEHFKELRAHCLKNWLEALNALPPSKNMSSSLYMLDIITGMPDWVCVELENPSGCLSSFPLEILLACGKLLSCPSYDTSMGYLQKEDILFSASMVYKKLHTLDKNWQDKYPEYLKIKKKIFAQIQSNPDTQALLAELLKQDLQNKIPEHESVTLKSKKVRL